VLWFWFSPGLLSSSCSLVGIDVLMEALLRDIIAEQRCFDRTWRSPWVFFRDFATLLFER
jgi:hypothetical protein